MAPTPIWVLHIGGKCSEVLGRSVRNKGIMLMSQDRNPFGLAVAAISGSNLDFNNHKTSCQQKPQNQDWAILRCEKP